MRYQCVLYTTPKTGIKQIYTNPNAIFYIFAPMVAKKNKTRLGSYPSFSVIASMTLALVVLGLFGVFILISSNLSTVIQEGIKAQVYLDKNLSESERLQIEKTLAVKEFTLVKDQTAAIQFVSKEKAAEAFIESTGEDFFEFLGDNPLRDSFVITIAPEYQDSEKLTQVKSDVESINGVFEFDYVESLLNDVSKNIRKIGLILIAFAFILLIAVIALINNTIKLALFSQRFLVRSMQLVGAKSSFIRKPFILRSGAHGLLAGFLASLGLFLLLNYGSGNLPGLEQLYTVKSLLIIFGALLITGFLVGVLGTYFAISKYLKMSLDELY